MLTTKTAKWMKYALRLLRPWLHALLLILIFIGAYYIRQRTDLIPGIQLTIPFIHIQDLILFACLSIVVFLAVQFGTRAYVLDKPLHWYYQRFFAGWLLWFVIMTFLALFGEWFVFQHGISRFIILFVAFAWLLLLTIFDVFWNMRNSRLEIMAPYRILALYTDQELLDQFVDEFEDYAIYDIRAVALEEYEPKKNWDKVDIVVILGNEEKELVQEIADYARVQDKQLFHIPDNYFLDDLLTTSSRLGPIVAMEYKPSPLEWWYRVLKRLFDVVWSAVLLFILSPLFVLIGIVILIDSRGPIFFVQKRVWRKEKPFNFIKFRSMYTQFSTGENYWGLEAERLYRKLIKKRNTRDDILPKIENDPRVTKVGRFLRKTSLDELPNLICVLIGSMSLVGPRPHLPNEVQKYEARMHRLYTVKPWMTGYAQIFGRDKIPFREEATLDLYYIQNRSFAMDLQVLLSTIKVVFAGR